MPRGEKYCCEEVREAIKNSSRHHGPCNKIKKCTVIQGKFLNGYLQCNRFKRETNYRICSNFKALISTYELPPMKNKKRTISQRDHNTRSSGSSLLNVTSLKRVQLKFSDTEEVFPVIDLTDEPGDEIIDTVESYSLDPETVIEEKEINIKRINFKKRILSIKMNQYRKSYKDATIRVRKDRAKTLAHDIIAMCYNSDTPSRFDDYLKTDDDLLININMVLDDCRDYMSVKLRRQFSDVPDNIPASPPPLEDDEDETSTKLDDCNKYSLAVALLGSTTKNKYNLLCDLICTAVGLSKKDMPSYHTLTKNRPSIVGEILTPSKDLFSEPVPVLEQPVRRIEEMFEEQL